MNRKGMLLLTAAVSCVCMLSAGTCVTAAVTQLSPTRIAASSTLYDGIGDYNCYNINDYDLSTAWVEGASGNGIGEYVDLFFPAGTVITGGTIYPGYYKNQNVFDMNSAVTRIQLQSGSQMEEVDTSAGAMTYSSGYGGLQFVLKNPITCDGTLRVRIMDVRSGWKYTDTCISEIHLETDDVITAGIMMDGLEPGEDPLDGAEVTYYEYPEPGEVPEQGQEPEMSETDEAAGSLATMAGWIYRWRHNDLREPEEDTIRVDDLTFSEKAFMLYWYQYNHNDPRVQLSDDYTYNSISDKSLKSILTEMFGKATKGDRDAFYDEYVESVENGICKVNATGDFGDAGWFYFSADGPSRMDGDRVKVTGHIMLNRPGENDYVPDMPFEAWFTLNDEGAVWKYCFDEVHVG